MSPDGRPSFDRLGPATPVSPVVLSVPHAGRDYPLALRAALRVPLDALLPLEDRYMDRIATAARSDETLFIARRPRAWIDLNRAEHERDPRVDDGARGHGAPLSVKVRGGLGLIPGRVAKAGDLWRRRWSADEVRARIIDDHRPYHAALAATLAAARARFGGAVLLDLHSMPSLPDGPSVVIGDRFGRSAAARIVARAESVARAHGHAVALNTPYPGGHILDRHAAPHAGIHAVQFEIDRACYLDTARREPGAGFAASVRLVRAIIQAFADEIGPSAIAAE